MACFRAFLALLRKNLCVRRARAAGHACAATTPAQSRRAPRSILKRRTPCATFCEIFSPLL